MDAPETISERGDEFWARQVCMLSLFPEVGASLMRVLFLGGLVGPLCFLFAVLVGASLRPDYDHTIEVMSALGATGSPNAILMNGVGFMPAGIMLIGLGLALLASGHARPIPGSVRPLPHP